MLSALRCVLFRVSYRLRPTSIGTKWLFDKQRGRVRFIACIGDLKHDEVSCSGIVSRLLAGGSGDTDGSASWQQVCSEIKFRHSSAYWDFDAPFCISVTNRNRLLAPDLASAPLFARFFCLKSGIPWLCGLPGRSDATTGCRKRSRNHV